MSSHLAGLNFDINARGLPPIIIVTSLPSGKSKHMRIQLWMRTYSTFSVSLSSMIAVVFTSPSTASWAVICSNFVGPLPSLQHPVNLVMLPISCSSMWTPATDGFWAQRRPLSPRCLEDKRGSSRIFPLWSDHAVRHPSS